MIYADPLWKLGSGFFLGCGYWTHSNAKICLLATRGKPKRVATDVSSLIILTRWEYSRKLDEARAELFARQKVAGWSAWGNEVECDFSL